MKKKDLDRLTANVDHWDEPDPNAKIEFLDEKETAELDEEIDEALGLETLTMRLDKTVAEELRKLAAARGITYQGMIREILANHVAVI